MNCPKCLCPEPYKIQGMYRCRNPNCKWKKSEKLIIRSKVKKKKDMNKRVKTGIYFNKEPTIC